MHARIAFGLLIAATFGAAAPISYTGLEARADSSFTSIAGDGCKSVQTSGPGASASASNGAGTITSNGGGSKSVGTPPAGVANPAAANPAAANPAAPATDANPFAGVDFGSPDANALANEIFEEASGGANGVGAGAANGAAGGGFKSVSTSGPGSTATASNGAGTITSSNGSPAVAGQ